MGPFGKADGAAEVALVVQVDGQDAVTSGVAVLGQQRRDGRLADAALVVRKNECLHRGLLRAARTHAPSR